MINTFRRNSFTQNPFFSLIDKMKLMFKLVFMILFLLNETHSSHEDDVQLHISAAKLTTRKIPETMFGVFFEEINHAGAGGIWAELVKNRGFEAGGQILPSNIWPWSIIGDESSIDAVTDRSSPFERNKIALRVTVHCDNNTEGVGVYNPGYWGMNVQRGKKYKVVFFVRSSTRDDVSVSFTSLDGSVTLASKKISGLASNWTRKEVVLEANGTDHRARLQLTTTRKGVFWFDQVSAMPLDTYKGLGFRTDLVQMMIDLKPRFIRFPGGCFVEGDWLGHAFRWKETVGPWEERAGHYGDVWKYWTDDGLGHFEFFQLAEAIGAAPVWVFNNGLSHFDRVEPRNLKPFVQEALDGIEFARGDPNSKWGSVRASMGHPKPFQLKYVSIGNEGCFNPFYTGNYMVFYNAIRKAYPDIEIISNCDHHPADYYDFHIYSLAGDLFKKSHYFDHVSRKGPKVFVSEYAVNSTDAHNGTLLAALGEAAFLLGLEKNSDIVGMVSYAPLFVNTNDRWWIPDAIVFNSSHHYGTPSYWIQRFFTESSGANLLKSTIEGNSSTVEASAISWQNSGQNFIQIKVVNFGNTSLNMKVSVTGLDSRVTKLSGYKKKVLTSSHLMDENSFSNPELVVPRETALQMDGENLAVVLPPHSFSGFDMKIEKQ